MWVEIWGGLGGEDGDNGGRLMPLQMAVPLGLKLRVGDRNQRCVWRRRYRQRGEEERQTERDLNRGEEEGD